MLATVLGLTLAAMLPVLLPGAGLAWDDVGLIRDSTTVRSPLGYLEVWKGHFWGGLADKHGDYYRPLVTLSYWVEVHLLGDDPLLQHWTNVALHLACVLLAARWLMRRVSLEGLPARTAGLWLAISLLVFAVHPSRPETVAWISGRTDAMALLFALAAMDAWASGVRLRGLWTPLLFVLALLCKETTVALVGLWLADAFLLEPEDGGPRRPSPAMWSVAGSVAVATLARLWLVPPTEHEPGTLQGVLAALGLYAGQLLAPFPPSAVIAPPTWTPEGVPSFSASWIAGGAATALAFAALAVAALRRASLRPWLADALWMLLPLVPVLHIMRIEFVAYVALRFLYIPMLGAAALLLRAGVLWSRRLDPSPRLIVAVAVATAMLYLPFTVAFASAYRSDRNLWAYEMVLDPDRSQVLHHAAGVTPATNAQARGELLRRALQAAVNEGNQLMVGKIAVDYVNFLAGQLPLDECPAELIHTLDRITTGQPARLGPGPDKEVHLQLSDEGGKRLRLGVPRFASLRAELLLRCGELEQALQNLQGLPESLEVGLMWVRALALRGKLQMAQDILAKTAANYPGEPEVEQMQKAMARAAELIHRARAARGLEAELLVIRLHLVLGDLTAAKAILNEVEAEAAQQPEFHHARFDLEWMAGRPEGAERALQQARAAIPEAEPLWQELARRLEGAP